MADQEFLQDETLFDDMTEMSEAGFVQTLIEDLFVEDGLGDIFREFSDILATAFAERESLEQVASAVASNLRTFARTNFKELEMGDSMLLTQSSDKEMCIAASRALRTVGDALV